MHLFNGLFFVHDGVMKFWCWSVPGHRVHSVVKHILQLYGSGAAAISETFMSGFENWIDVVDLVTQSVM